MKRSTHGTNKTRAKALFDSLSVLGTQSFASTHKTVFSIQAHSLSACGTRPGSRYRASTHTDAYPTSNKSILERLCASDTFLGYVFKMGTSETQQQEGKQDGHYLWDYRNYGWSLHAAD
jgi:hypothetical protein